MVLAAIRFVEAAQVGEAAAGMARRLGQPLHLVHVLPPEAAQVPGDAVKAFISGALSVLSKRLATGGLQVTAAVRVGETHAELNIAAEQSEASLLVVGLPPPDAGRGRGGTVERLAWDCPVPLLAVPNAEPFASWGDKRPLRIQLGIDTSPPTRAAVSFVEKLARAGPVDLTAVRLVYAFSEARRLGVPVPMDYQDLGLQLEAALRREVEDVLAPARAAARSTHVRLLPSLGRGGDLLVTEGLKADADLLAVGTHHRRALGRLWSVSHQAVSVRRMAVLIVPTTGAPSRDAHGINTVVVGTDFSPLGNQAVTLGLAAMHSGGTLHLVHVAKGPLTAEERTAVLGRLLSLVPNGTADIRVEAEVRVKNHPPGSDEATSILQSAEQAGADLIAIGAAGPSGLRSLLGSVAERVLASSPRPVLIARLPE